VLTNVEAIEEQIEKALWKFEVHGELDAALEVYREAESSLEAMQVPTDHPAYLEQQRVLSYCLMRQGNILRQTGRAQEAFTLGEREMAAARLAGNEITLARCLLSNGTNHVVAGEIERGLALLEEARVLFESGHSDDHRQGLGWYWILQADLANAGIVGKDPSEVLGIASRALQILAPIENWPGVARAYVARAKAHDRMGKENAAARDRQKQRHYESMVQPEIVSTD
jgi:tetratricopeptide (TPR) repeat protein